jgi:hypothetical protein
VRFALDADGAGRQAFQVALETFGGTWGAGFVTAEPVDALGYASLAFAFRADAVEPTSVPRLLVRLNGLLVDLIRGADAYRIDFAEPDWQIIEIPLQEFTLVTGGTQGILPRVEPVLEIDAVHFIGNLTGTFRLDDVRVVTAVKAAPPSTLVREPEAGQFPAAFELAQNYPNPFNAETVIRYSLAARAAVHVSVYNLAGQRLLTLVDGERPAGTHTITWDGRDEGGESLPPGFIYTTSRSNKGSLRCGRCCCCVSSPLLSPAGYGRPFRPVPEMPRPLAIRATLSTDC